jgi:predicted MPP superfamily phosphohydrolase
MSPRSAPASAPATPGSGEASGPRVEPRRYGQGRLRFYRGVELALRLAGGRRFYRSLHLARGRFRLREEVVRVPGLHPGLPGFLVAQLSDFHAGPFLGEGDLAAVVEAVNAARPHVVALTGDFITHHWSEIGRILPDLARLRARRGIFAVFGNHDYKDRQEHKIASALSGVGVTVLRNQSVRIERNGGSVAVVGLEDVEEARNVEILLCHNPRAAPALVRRGCAAILCGHTHGTQVDLPVLRRLGPQHPGLRIQIGSTAVIVSRGLGAVGLPLRVGAPAEVVLCRLAPA